ncbi:MAG: HAMP domain-containing sensor histidine kinase [bacterium]|nr:HAMP domain-containing sensor histidine kinase [bacterium]
MNKEELKNDDEFISILTHELKNPLNAIKISSQLMEKEIRSPKKLNSQDYLLELLSKIDKQGDNILNILDTFSRVNKLRFLERSAVSVNQILSEVLENLRPFIINFNVKILTDYDLKMPKLLLNPGLIKEAFYNVVLNSVQVSDSIVISSEFDRESVIIRIRDNGPGISPENQAKVFTPYFTMKKTGSGLGLYFAKKIIESYGGEISFHSILNSGTEFKIKFKVSEIKE